MLVLKQYRFFPYCRTWSSQIEISSPLAESWRLKYSLCGEEELSFLWILLDLFRIKSNLFVYVKIYPHIKNPAGK